MDAAAYDAWYRTPRGAWIGDVEFRGRPPLGAFIAAAGDVSRRAPDAESTREFR